MSHAPYAGIDPAQLTLNDHLAVDRTVLSNHRTLMSYLRTAFALLVLGISLFEFFTASQVNRLLAYASIACGVLTAIIGFYQFRRVQRRLQPLRLR